MHARDLKAHGAMTVLLKDALQPNLVQTLENNPAFMHGGPFANIAHGCNSVIATKTALKLADYVVTEAGFGADLGAEKFIDIKCRKSGLRPSAVVIVATMRALKYHGGVDLKELNKENLAALEKGIANLERHVEQRAQSLRLAVRGVDQPLHLRHGRPKSTLLKKKHGARTARRSSSRTHWAEGGAGAADARAQGRRLDRTSAEPTSSSSTKTRDRCGRRSTRSRPRSMAPPKSPPTRRCAAQIKKLQEDGYGHYPGVRGQDAVLVLDRRRSCAARRPAT